MSQRLVGKTPLIVLAAVACLSLSAANSSAQVTPVFQDNFESYTSQTDFNNAWPVVSTQPSATWSTDQATSPTHSILSPAVTTAQGNTVAARNMHTFTATTPTATNSVVYQFNFFDSTATNASYRQYANLQNSAAPGSGGLISLGLNNNIISTSYMARVLGYDGGQGSGAYFPLDGTGVGTTPPGRTTGWHALKAVISPTEIDLYVDGTLARVVPPASVTWSPQPYDRMLLGSGLSNNGNAAYFDDVLVGTVTGVPEPTSLALAGLAASGLAARLVRRRRSKEM
jgi:hypothetical protein